MATDYCYYISGNQLALLEYDEEEGQWDSPTEAVTNGIIVEYTKTITDPTAYNSSINISREIADAVVNYLKSKMEKDPRMQTIYYGKFLTKVRGEVNRMAGRPRICIPRNVYSVR